MNKSVSFTDPAECFRPYTDSLISSADSMLMMHIRLTCVMFRRLLSLTY